MKDEERALPLHKTIMIVEDNYLNLKLYQDLLNAKGYGVLHASEPKKVLEMTREANPDLILMDVRLPEVSGLDITRWLKQDETLKTIPVIAVTAFAMKGDEESNRECGCDAYIAVPISVVQFLETVDRFLGTDPSPSPGSAALSVVRRA